ncbi:MAG: carbohydrate ABC transporter permease [Anaerolineaceae bacterium]|nr:MAG: carbohydrate ABC transporter permease [Anaerolineaceae bacterium]
MATLANHVHQRPSHIQRLRKNLRFEVITRVLIRYSLALLATFIFVYPLIWLASASVKPNWEIYRQPLQLIPSEVQWDVYERLFQTAPFARYMTNSVIYALGGSLISLAFSILAAYGLSRYRFRGKRLTMVLILTVQLIPGLVSMIPLYLMMRWLGLFNTQHGMVLLYGSLRIPWAIWVLKGYFDTIPIELDESAWIDGASKFRTIWQILMPVLVPGLVAAFIIIFIGLWNEFALASVLLRNPDYLPVSVGTYVLLGPDESDFRLTAAASLVNIIPILLIFSVLQRYLVSGLAAGAVKQ